MTDELERYIREHRATYTREALTKELIDAGHDPSAISAAWASVEAGDQSTGEPPPAVAPVGWGDGGGAAPAGGPTAPAGPPGVGVGTVLLLIGLTLAYAAAAMASLAAFSYNPL